MKRILLIDDDKDILEMVQVILADRYQVEFKSEYDGVVDKLKSYDPHLIMLDNSLGEYSSADFITEIRGITALKAIPVVLFSAHYDIDKIASKINADGYLAKPFSLAELQTILDKHMGEE